MNTTNQAPRDWYKTSVTFKFIIVGFMILVLLIPSFLVRNLIRERETYREQVINEISSKWGNSQVISGPVLVVPFMEYTKAKNEIFETRRLAYFLPEDLSIKGLINPEIRYRGIYKVIVYESALVIEGFFNKPDFSEWKVKDEHILWDQAFLAVGIPDMRGIKKIVKIRWNKEEHVVEPGITNISVFSSGFTSLVPIGEETTYRFQFDLNLNGSEMLEFIPVGRETHVSIRSGWNNPKFDGAFLPDDREISDTGFSASWNVLHLNRNFPQKWTDENVYMNESAFGIKLLFPVDQYQKSERSAKYAIMFIALTFLVFFFTELLNKKRVHPVQYILVGLALIVFYTLLVSFSEHMSFNLAYLIASIAVVLQITLYTFTVFKSRKLTLLMASFLAILYTFLFTILQLQDYSLLLGSIAWFVVIGAIMYFSRKVDWYNTQEQDKTAGKTERNQ